MKLRMFGLDHQTAPVAIREQFAFPEGQIEETLKRWLRQYGDYEAVLVSTCNRTEFYVASSNGSIPDEETLFHFLSSGEARPFSELRPYFRTLSDSEVVSHLFRVTASLESMVLGEPQIQSQIKCAYQHAAESGSTGSILHSIFQTALRVSKRISTETDLFRHRVSIPSVAVVDFALNLFEKLDDKRTLVLGAGEMARETVRYLVEEGACQFTVINRNREHAEELALLWKGSTDDWKNRFEVLKQSDLLIAATASDQPILTQADYRTISQARLGHPLFILDLAIPRNIDPALASFPEVYLYSLDDLQNACQKNARQRDRELPKADRIIQQETARFLQESHRRDSSDLIRSLRETWNGLKEEELDRLFHKCPDFTTKDEEEIRYAFERLVNKLLHPPMESLKDESDEENRRRLPELLRRLFRL